jgi:tetratricopeptide (TPR) repeat protein
MREAYKLSTKAVELSDALDSAHYALGMVFLAMRQHDKAIAEGEKAVELSPNGANAHFALAMFLKFAGRPTVALAHINKAIRLNPMPSSTYYCILGTLHRDMNQYDKAIAAFKKGLHVHPDSAFCWINLTAAYSLAGRQDKAREAAAEILKRNPRFSLKYFAKQIPFKNPASAKRVVDALRKAGLK